VSDAATEPDGYLIERVREALAHDERAGVLDVDVRVAGAKVFVRGDAGTPERRAAITTLLGELLPDHDVHNEMSVADWSNDAGAPEELP
jgi:hypothetical protein